MVYGWGVVWGVNFVNYYLDIGILFLSLCPNLKCFLYDEKSNFISSFVGLDGYGGATIICWFS